MERSDLALEWSKLLPLEKDEVDKLDGTKLEGVYRISKKEPDGKFYVVFIGSTSDLKDELLKLISKESDNFFKQGGEFSFRHSLVKGEEIRKAIEKQMYKQYAPEHNSKEPNSSLDIKVNLN